MRLLNNRRVRGNRAEGRIAVRRIWPAGGPFPEDTDHTAASIFLSDSAAERRTSGVHHPPTGEVEEWPHFQQLPSSPRNPAPCHRSQCSGLLTASSPIARRWSATPEICHIACATLSRKYTLAALSPGSWRHVSNCGTASSAAGPIEPSAKAAMPRSMMSRCPPGS